MKQAMEALDRRLDPVSPAPVVVALSCGGDSLALLHIAVDWAKTHGRRVLALSVDHGLNPESAAWTAEAGAKAQALGCDWRALVWEGAKPATGLQAKARAARHGLLAEATREGGAKVLLMGHTASDVAEGDRMRAEETRGLGRLREWSPSPVWPAGRGVFLLRPLLGAHRADLRAGLAARGAAWLDDPANADRRFARVRARAALEEAGGAAVDVEFETDAQLGALARVVSFAPGCAHAPCGPFVQGEPLAVRWVLTALTMSVGGAVVPPRREELDRVAAVVRDGGVCTLAGCRIEVAGALIAIYRAPDRAAGTPHPEAPPAWVARRFNAACGLYPDEASIPPST